MISNTHAKCSPHTCAIQATKIKEAQRRTETWGGEGRGKRPGSEAVVTPPRKGARLATTPDTGEKLDQLLAGCSKCRFSKGGCARCKKRVLEQRTLYVCEDSIAEKSIEQRAIDVCDDISEKGF